MRPDGEICIGPAGGCAQCYHSPCRCGETEAERSAREARVRHQRKADTAHGREIVLLDCEACKGPGVVPDDVVRAYVCLRCGQQQKPQWTPGTTTGADSAVPVTPEPGKATSSAPRSDAFSSSLDGGWREIASAPKDGDCEGCRRFMHALGGSTVRLYPDQNYEQYLDQLIGSAIDGVGDVAEEGNEHGSALIRQLTEAVTALRLSRDELRRDMNRVALAAICDEDHPGQASKPLPSAPRAREQ